MTDYFKEEYLISAKKQRNLDLTVYFIVLGLFIAFSVACFIYHGTFPYYGYRDTAEKVNLLKLIHYVLTGIFVIFSFVFLGIKFKRVNRYYRQCFHMQTGLRETSVGNFLEVDENIQDKDGVDFKSLIFLEWNKYKKDFFERKVLVFYEKDFPEIPVGTNVRYITQGNVLISYEVLDDEPSGEEKDGGEKTPAKTGKEL